MRQRQYQSRMPQINESIKKLARDHLNFLLDQKVLQEWKCLSLARRCVMFHKRIPETKLSPTTLRRVYNHHGIHFKVMVYQKRHTAQYDIKLKQQRLQAFDHLIKAIRKGQTVQYLDETLFKPYNITGKSWAHKYEKQVAHKIAIKAPTVAAAVCVSSSTGLASYIQREKSIKTLDLVRLIQNASRDLGRKRITVLAINLSSHHSKDFKKEIAERGWEIVYNTPYSPQYNCIERAFVKVKQRYKKYVLECDFQLSHSAHRAAIQRSFEGISKSFISKLEKSQLQKMIAFITEFDQ